MQQMHAEQTQQCLKYYACTVPAGGDTVAISAHPAAAVPLASLPRLAAPHVRMGSLVGPHQQHMARTHNDVPHSSSAGRARGGKKVKCGGRASLGRKTRRAPMHVQGLDTKT